MGRYRCPNCGRTRPEPQVAATRVELEGMDGLALHAAHAAAASWRLRLPLPGLYNVYNAVAAAATALELGVPLATLGEALEGFGGAFGRVETIPIDGRQLSILLIKNPAGANEVLRTLTLEDGELDLWIALNDNIADGRDVSWIWDADFEVLAGRVRRVTCSGTRAEEMALRLKYAGIDAQLDVERDLGDSLDARPGTPPASASTRSPPTRRCSSCATCSPTAGSRSGGPSDGRGGDLARRGARLLRRRPAAVARSLPTRPAARSWTSAPAPAACPWIWPHRAMTWWRSTATRSCSPSSRAGAGRDHGARRRARRSASTPSSR